MQLTRAADYGVRVMIHLASLPGDDRVLLSALAKSTGTPESFLSKVLQALGHAGMITSRRGKAGGFVLLPRGREASMYDVIEAIEGPIFLNVCLADGKNCERTERCPAHSVWAQAQRAMLDILKHASITEMAHRTAGNSATRSESPFSVLKMTT